MKHLIYINSIIQFLMMVFVPYKILLIQQNTENLPLVLGISMITGALTSIYIGKISDKNRRLTFLFGTILLMLIVFGYTFVHSLIIIIIFESLYGVAYAIYQISEKAIIADLAIEKGKEIGKYSSILYMVSGLALIVSSLFVVSIQWLFPIIALCLLIPNVIILKYLK